MTDNECKIYLVSQHTLERWFKESTGTAQNPWYESATTNFVAQNAEQISGEPTVRVWVEMKLGSEEVGDATSPDVVIETVSGKLWVIEVKYTYDWSDIVEAKKQVFDYGEAIKKLGWWKTKEGMQLAVVWAYYNTTPTEGTEIKWPE